VAATIAAAIVAAVSGLPAGAGAAAPVVCGTNHWVATWTADPSGTVGPALNNQTLRVILTPHIGGDTLRVHLSNLYGRAPVTFAHAALAIRLGSAAVIDNSQRQMTFSGQPSVTVPVGGEVISDPVTLTFAPFQDLAVSLFLASPTGSATGHLIARERSYATGGSSGDHTSDLTGNAFTSSTTSSSFVDAVDTLAPADVSAAVLFGDSITDGFESGGGSGEEQGGIDLNHRYPDYLQQRILAEAGAPLLSVVNAGISGNRVLVDGQQGSAGASALNRLNSDVIGVAGVSDAIVLEGINDIALLASAPQMETALTQIVNRLHASGIHVLIGTLIPAGTGLLNLGSLLPSIYIDSSANAVRVALNTWIRSGASGADGIVDFDAALRSSSNGFELNAGFDSGDHVHPSYSGYDKMAETVDLAQLQGAGPCIPPPPPQATKVRLRAGGRPGHALRVTGSLVTALPANCTGAVVTVRALRGGRSLLKRNVPVTASCTFAKTFALHAKGRIAVRVGFAGRPSLLASHAGPVYARVR
jgi:lysophospholipase L1-like esterase